MREVSWETVTLRHACSPWEGNQVMLDRSNIYIKFRLTEEIVGDELVTGGEFIQKKLHINEANLTTCDS